MAKNIILAVLPSSVMRKFSGQVFLLMSVALVVLVGMAALAVDVGNLWTTRRLMQSAADSGALAGADELALGGDSSAITTSAKDASSHNGFTDGASRAGGAGSVTVSVHNPPTSGAYASNVNAVQVDVAQTQNTYFMKVLGWNTVPVSTTAVAVTLGSGSCVYSLDHTDSGAITVGGSASVGSACGFYDNSNSSSALSVSGGGSITAPLIGVVGGTSISGGGTTSPTTGIAQFGDPLAYIPAPSFDSSSCGSFKTTNLSSGTVNPGTFCGGISINSGANVTFSPGLYIIDGGGLTINGGATVSGTGVTFYLTGDNKGSSGPKNYAGVNINSTSTVNFSSPCNSSNGGVPGMLFFEDRSETNGPGSTIVGSASSTFSGAIYFPTTSVAYAGGSGASGFTVLVADTLSFLGNSSVGNDESCLSQPLIKDAVLVQ